MPNGPIGAEQVVKLFEVGNWAGYEKRDSNGYLSGYYVVVYYVTGTVIGFTMKLDSDLILMVTDDDSVWGQEGANTATKLVLSSPAPIMRPKYEVSLGGNLLKSNKARFDLGNNLTILTEIKQHYLMQFNGNVNTTSLKLTGSKLALTTLATYLPVPGQQPSADQAPWPADFNPEDYSALRLSLAQ